MTNLEAAAGVIRRKDDLRRRAAVQAFLPNGRIVSLSMVDGELTILINGNGVTLEVPKRHRAWLTKLLTFQSVL